MKVIRETCIAGKTIFRSVKSVTTSKKVKGEKRNPKTKPSKEAVQKVNQRNAEKMLTLKINHNFKPGDWHITLTYEVEPDIDTAKKDKEKFLRNLKNYAKKNNITFKRVDVTEYENKRVHHHIVMSYIDPEVIKKYWNKGIIRFAALDQSGNYKKLAEYLIKETSKTFRKNDNPNKRRYNCSRNIETPEIKRERVHERELYRDIKPLKGYYIDEDSIRRYEHAITKAECLEYIMVSIDEEPRIKKWRKGKTCKIRNYPISNSYSEEQMEIGDLN